MPADTRYMKPAMALSDLAPIALISLTDERCIADVNPAAEGLLRQSRKLLCGLKILEVFGEDSVLHELLDRAAHSGNDLTAHGVNLFSAGFRRGLIFTINLRPHRPDGFILALSEEAGRETTEMMGAVAGFGRILGHEVKNPLAGIIGAAQLLRRQAKTEQTELLDVIKDEANRIERLVTRLSAFELFSNPRYRPINIHKLLDRIIAAEKAALDGSVIYERQYDPSLPVISADEDHLHEAVLNIMRNAAEAVQSSQAGSGSICVQTAFVAGLSLREARKDKPFSKAMKISIEDTGEGVSRAQHSEIFEMFRSSKSGGRGLGLAIANEIVSAHGGYIKLDSRPGKTVFSIFLPIDRGRPNA